MADFGLARLQDSTRLASVSGSGTPAYMAPEVWRGKANERSDQYSLAMSYAELRLDRRVFTGQDMMEIMLDHTERQPDLASLPEAEKQVILKAMAKDPAQRYPSCLAFIRALQQAVVYEDVDPSAGAAASLSPRSPATEQTAGWSPAQSSASTAAADEAVPDRAGSQPRLDAGGRRKRGLLGVIGVLLMLLAGAVAVLAVKYWPPGLNIPEAEKPKALLPVQCEPAEGAKDITDMSGKSYVQRILRQLPDGAPVEFILVPQQSAGDPPTFYMMDNKVTNGLFARFAAARPEAVRDSVWQRGADADGHDLMNDNPQLPVMRVTVKEADLCARWLGGQLPTAQEWDRAAGYPASDGRLGPFPALNNNVTLTVNRRKQGPRPITEATTDDESPLGIRDMAGNGREFTRNLANNPEGRIVPLAHPGKDDLVILRSRSYAATKPLLYEDLDYQQNMPQTQYYLVASPYTGFRVVLELRQ